MLGRIEIAKIRLLGGVVVLSSLLPTITARAEESQKPSIDKSVYSLFNPVPDDKLREFSADRPGKSHSSITVDAGHFQVESDFFIYTWDPGRGDRPTTRAYSIGTPIFKVGITNSIDFEVATSFFNHLRQTGGGSPPLVANGFGDMSIGAKINLFGNDGGNQSLALIPFVKLPTAAQDIGNGHTEFMLNAPYTINAKPWALTLEPNFGILRNGSNSGYRENYGFIANLSRPVFSEKLTAAIEIATDVSSEPGSKVKVSLDPSLQYLVTRDLQLDVGISIGLNSATPKYIPYVGFSYRY
jgi:Putative MetA-pathway of phenol degradation